MDNQARDELVARLSDAEQRRSTLRFKMQAHAASIEKTRQALGNPYFYSAKAVRRPRIEIAIYRVREPRTSLSTLACTGFYIGSNFGQASSRSQCNGVHAD